MSQKEPVPESSLPVETPPETAVSEAAVPENALASDSIKQTVSKELKELVKSYVEYAKNVDL